MFVMGVTSAVAKPVLTVGPAKSGLAQRCCRHTSEGARENSATGRDEN